MHFSPLSPKLLLAATALLVAAPSPASATAPSAEHACSLAPAPNVNQGPALVDQLGFRFDTSAVSGQVPEHYATLADGSHPSIVSRTLKDAWDDWGDLYVGDTQASETRYVDADPLGCQLDASGRRLDFAETTIGGLKVKRNLFVSATTGQGARLVQSVTNPGQAAVTTSVFVGDLTNTTGRGTFGSDAGTTLGTTSSGDAMLSTADRWAVTSDATGTDPALSHVWDGEDGALAATVVRSGAQIGTSTLAGNASLSKDRFGYAWQDVTIPAGGTVAFLSWEAMSAADQAAEQVGLAEDAAAAISAAPASTVFEGLTATEIAAVRNWAKPEPTVELGGVTGASVDADVAFSAPSLTYAPASIPVCNTGTLSWDFGDGTTATGTSPSHRFAAGPAVVTVTATNACGGTKTAATAFTVRAATPTPTVTPTPTPTPTATRTPTPTPTPDFTAEGTGSSPLETPAPAPTATPAPAASAPAPSVPVQAAAQPAAPAELGPSVAFTAPDKLTIAALTKKGLGTEISATATGALRVVLSGGGLKRVKTMTLVPGAPRTPTFKFTAADLPALKRATKLQVRAKLTLADGREIITSRFVTVRK